MVAVVSKIPSLFKAATKNGAKPLSKLSAGELKDLLNKLRSADKDSAMFGETAKVETALTKKQNADNIAQAGSRAIAPEVRSQMRREGAFVGTPVPTNAKPRNTMSQLDRQEVDFDGLNKGTRDSLIDKVQRGEKATYKGVDYTSMLGTRKGHKPMPSRVGKPAPANVPAAKRKGPKQPVSLAGSPKVGGTQKKSYGGSMGKKTVKKQSGGRMASKPKGVGCAQRGYGKAMK